MKKQYLISLLGLTAIFVPLGSSFSIATLSTSSTVETEPSGTGLSISNDSTIGINDRNNNGEIDVGDSLYNIYFNLSYNPENRDSSFSYPGWRASNDENIERNGILGLRYFATNKTGELIDSPFLNGYLGSYFVLKNFRNSEINQAENSNNQILIQAYDENSLDDSWIWDYRFKSGVKFNSINFDIPIKVTADYCEGCDKNQADLADIKSDLIGEIKWTIYAESTIEEDGNVQDITSTSAKVDYEVIAANNDEVEEVKWIDLGENNEYDDTDEIIATSKAASGTLEATNLIPNHDYNTVIMADMVHVPTNKTEIEQFKTLPGNIPTEIEETHDVNVISSTEASVGYKIDLGKNDDGIPVTLTSVKWMNGDDELAYSTATSGFLTTDKLIPNQDYDNTTIEAEVSDESEVAPLEVDLFKAGSASTQTIVSETAEVEVTSSTSAKVGYEVDLGTDADGKPVTVDEVRWMNGDDELAKDTVGEGDGIDGVLETNKLEPFENYEKTTIEVDVSDKSIVSPISIEKFQAQPGNTPTKSSETKEVEVTSSTSAKVGYELDLGKDVYGNEVEVKEVRWMNGDDVLAKDTASEGEGIDGVLETNELEPNQWYIGTTIEVDVNDESNVDPISIEKFHADSGAKKSTITANDGVQVNGPTVASVNYIINEGKAKNGVDVTTKEVSWIDLGENNEYDNTDEIIATDIVDVNSGIDGTLEADNLVANTPYNTAIIAKMSDGSETKLTSLEQFTTNAIDEITPTIDCINVKTTATTAIFDYEAVFGKDKDGNDYVLADVIIKDNHGQDVSSKNVDDGEFKENGSIIVEELDPNTSYSGWTMEAVFNNLDTGSWEKEVEDTDICSFDTLKDAPQIIAEPSAVIDETNNILEVEGTIVSNGSDITTINILKDGNVLETNTIELKQIDHNEWSYDIWTDEYTGIDNDLTGYSLQVIYSVNGDSNLELEQSYLLASITNVTDADLSSLLNDSSQTNVNNSELWIIIAIIFVSLLIVSVIGADGYYLYSKKRA